MFRPLKGGGTDSGKSPPPPKKKRSPNKTRLSSLRTERMSDSDWNSLVTDSETDTAPGQGRRGANRGRGAAARGGRGAARGGRGAARGGRGAAQGGRGAARGRRGGPHGSVAGASLYGWAGQGPTETESGDTCDTEQGKDTEEENDDTPTRHIQAWEESEGETSATHDELVDIIPEDDSPEEFEDDESDETIKRNYEESRANQMYRRQIMARSLFKKKVLKKNGFESGGEADNEDDNDNGNGPKNAPPKGRRTWKKNGLYQEVGLRRKQQKIASVEKIFGNDRKMKIEYAKKVLKKEGIKYEHDEDAPKNKIVMLALSALAKNKLTQKSYESLRFSNIAMFGVYWPSWLELLEARKQCWPEDIEVNQEGAFYSLRNVVVHTNQRYATR